MIARFDRGQAALLRRFSDWGWVCALLAFLWFFYASTWGMFELYGSGHLGGGTAGVAMCGENCFRWNTWYPSFGWYTAQQPGSDHLLCSHPQGSPWLAGLAIKFLGHVDVAPRLPAIIMSVAMPPLLYVIGKKAWEPVAGAAASWGFACLPLTMAFANYNNLEVLAIFGCVVMFAGQTYYQRTGNIGYLMTTLLGVVLACSGDWPAFVVIGIVLGWGLLRAFVLPASLGPPRFREYARWWALTATFTVLMFSLWFALFYHKDLIDCLFAQAARRTGPSEALDAVLRRRRTWIDLSFTPPAIFIGKLALPVTIGRLIVRRRDEEVFAVAILVAATIQYVAFTEGADVHTFWPHYFGLYYALALAQLVATIRETTIWVLQRWGSKATWHRPENTERVANAVGLGLLGITLVLVLPDATRGFKFWRLTGGMYPGSPTGRDLVYVLENVVAPRLGEGHIVDLHASAQLGWERTWAVAHEVADVQGAPSMQPQGSKHSFWVARASKMDGASWRTIPSSASVAVYDDTWVVDQRAGPAPLEAFSLREREPNLLQRWTVASVEPVRSIDSTPDEFLTWEVRRHIGQHAERPTRSPRTLDQRRIAYNASVDAGDQAAAAVYRQTIERELGLRFPASFTEGVHLLGSRIVRGAQPVVEAWFEVQGPLRDDVRFDVSSTITRKATFSFIPVDPQVVHIAAAPPVPSTLWKPDFIYCIRIPVFHRPGEELLRGAWIGGAGSPKRRDGAGETELGVYR